MSLQIARKLGWNLSRTLMTLVVVIRSDKGFQVMPIADYDGDSALIVAEFDPFA